MAGRAKATTETTTPKKGPRYVAVVALKDHPDHVGRGETAKEYKPGDDVSDWPKDRLKSAIARGVVKETTAPAEKSAEKAETGEEGDNDNLEDNDTE